jgi:hypothetical protein
MLKDVHERSMTAMFHEEVGAAVSEEGTQAVLNDEGVEASLRCSIYTAIDYGRGKCFH